jgi:hypothetical protein
MNDLFFKKKYYYCKYNMKQKIQILTFILLYLLQTNLIKAQKTKVNKNEPTSDIKPFLENGLGKKRYNLIRIRFGRLASGYPGLSYERRITKKLGVEVGGYYSLFRVDEAIDFLGYPIANKYNFHIFPKRYYIGNSLNGGVYLGACYRYMLGLADEKYIKSDEANYSAGALTINIGSQGQIGKIFTIGVEYGVGGCISNFKSYEKLSNPTSYVPDYLSSKRSFFLMMTMDVKLGVLF